MIKKCLALFFALLALFSFAACGGAASSSQSAGGAVSGTAGVFTADGRQYITANQLKADIEAGKDMFLLDIQPQDTFEKAHLQGAVGTFAFPVETDDEKAKVSAVLADAAGKPLIIVCPGGKGGANNTWAFLSANGYDMASVYILENGQNGWPHPALLAAAGTPQSTPAVGQVAAIGAQKIYVSPQWVNSVINKQQPQSSNYVIIEASWGQAGDEYLGAHLPGAVHMNTDLIEEEEYWNIRTPEEIAQVMKDFGITKDTVLITYGADSAACRVAFVAFWAGVTEVHVLDGGLKAWGGAGFATEKGNVPPTPTEKDFGTKIPARGQYLQRMPNEVQASQKDANYRLVSIRSWEEFIGETSGYGYIDRAGEPQGAVWGHDEADYYNENGTLKDFGQISAMLAEWDVTKDNDVAFYCGTGWRATVPFFACYENGWQNIKLYDGGWYVWQMDENLPVQTGNPRG